MGQPQQQHGEIYSELLDTSGEGDLANSSEIYDEQRHRYIFDRPQSPTPPFFSVPMSSACYDYGSVTTDYSCSLFSAGRVHFGDSPRT